MASHGRGKLSIHPYRFLAVVLLVIFSAAYLLPITSSFGFECDASVSSCGGGQEDEVDSGFVEEDSASYEETPSASTELGTEETYTPPPSTYTPPPANSDVTVEPETKTWWQDARDKASASYDGAKAQLDSSLESFKDSAEAQSEQLRKAYVENVGTPLLVAADRVTGGLLLEGDTVDEKYVAARAEAEAGSTMTFTAVKQVATGDPVGAVSTVVDYQADLADRRADDLGKRALQQAGDIIEAVEKTTDPFARKAASALLDVRDNPAGVVEAVKQEVLLGPAEVKRTKEEVSAGVTYEDKAQQVYEQRGEQFAQRTSYEPTAVDDAIAVYEVATGDGTVIADRLLGVPDGTVGLSLVTATISGGAQTISTIADGTLTLLENNPGTGGSRSFTGRRVRDVKAALKPGFDNAELIEEKTYEFASELCSGCAGGAYVTSVAAGMLIPTLDDAIPGLDEVADVYKATKAEKKVIEEAGDIGDQLPKVERLAADELPDQKGSVLPSEDKPSVGSAATSPPEVVKPKNMATSPDELGKKYGFEDPYAPSAKKTEAAADTPNSSPTPSATKKSTPTPQQAEAPRPTADGGVDDPNFKPVDLGDIDGDSPTDEAVELARKKRSSGGSGSSTGENGGRIEIPPAEKVDPRGGVISADPGVDDTVAALEKNRPGSVKNVGEKVLETDGAGGKSKIETDLDVVTDGAVIQQKVGVPRAPATLKQAKTTQEAIDKGLTSVPPGTPVVIYLPDAGENTAVVKALREEGFTVFSKGQQDQLVGHIDDLGKATAKAVDAAVPPAKQLSTAYDDLAQARAKALAAEKEFEQAKAAKAALVTPGGSQEAWEPRPGVTRKEVEAAGEAEKAAVIKVDNAWSEARVKQYQAKNLEDKLVGSGAVTSDQADAIMSGNGAVTPLQAKAIQEGNIGVPEVSKATWKPAAGTPGRQGIERYGNGDLRFVTPDELTNYKLENDAALAKLAKQVPANSYEARKIVNELKIRSDYGQALDIEMNAQGVEVSFVDPGGTNNVLMGNPWFISTSPGPYAVVN